MKDIISEFLILSALRDCIILRNAMNTQGFSDEKGALQSVEYLLDLLSMQRKYGLTKLVQLKKSQTAERTHGVTLAINCGDAIRVQHIHTLREWALSFIAKVDEGLSDHDLLSFIDENYRLVLVTLLHSRALRSEFIPGTGIDRFDYIGLKMDTLFYAERGIIH